MFSCQISGVDKMFNCIAKTSYIASMQGYKLVRTLQMSWAGAHVRRHSKVLMTAASTVSCEQLSGQLQMH